MYVIYWIYGMKIGLILEMTQYSLKGANVNDQCYISETICSIYLAPTSSIPSFFPPYVMYYQIPIYWTLVVDLVKNQNRIY